MGVLGNERAGDTVPTLSTEHRHVPWNLRILVGDRGPDGEGAEQAACRVAIPWGWGGGAGAELDGRSLNKHI